MGNPIQGFPIVLSRAQRETIIQGREVEIFASLPLFFPHALRSSPRPRGGGASRKPQERGEAFPPPSRFSPRPRFFEKTRKPFVMDAVGSDLLLFP